MFFQEPRTFPVTQAEEQDIHCLDVAGKNQVRLAGQVRMHGSDRLTLLTAALYEGEVDLGMTQQQTHRFPAGIARSTDDPCLKLACHCLECSGLWPLATSSITWW